MNTDRIEKQILLKAPRERVWRAIADSKQFGSWFGMALDGPFVAGQLITGKIAQTTVDPEVAKLQKDHVGKRVEFKVERIEPMERFEFSWHPFGVDPNIDYSKEPMTLVRFELREAAGGVLLTITESGFDKIPLQRRAQAFAANDGGWAHQTRLIEKYLQLHPR